ncbi:gluconokinase GntK (plasmid) [Paenibacillus larvae subsp. larvae DSM 25430]|nr:gluconokinase GntK [Paenibacillus larvae subsp. larvae DSM 25430]
MNRKTYMIGIDIGTTSTKAVLFEEDGKVVARGNGEYPLYTPASTIAEQDPEQIFQAVIQSVRQVMTQSRILPDDILFVSFSSAMHSMIAVDTQGKPLTPCVTWADNRSSQYAGKLKYEMNGHELYLRTGTPIHPMSPITKLMWMRHEAPEIFQKNI